MPYKRITGDLTAFLDFFNLTLPEEFDSPPSDWREEGKRRARLFQILDSHMPDIFIKKSKLYLRSDDPVAILQSVLKKRVGNDRFFLNYIINNNRCIYSYIRIFYEEDTKISVTWAADTEFLPENEIPKTREEIISENDIFGRVNLPALFPIEAKDKEPRDYKSSCSSDNHAPLLITSSEEKNGNQPLIEPKPQNSIQDAMAWLIIYPIVVSGGIGLLVGITLALTVTPAVGATVGLVASGLSFWATRPSEGPKEASPLLSSRMK